MKRAVLVCTFAVFAAVTAAGEVIQFEFAGDLTSLNDPGGHAGGATTFSGAFVFDTTAEDTDPSPTIGQYAGVEFNLDIGGIGIVPPTVNVTVGNNEMAGWSQIDRLVVTGTGRTPSNIDVANLAIALVDNSAGVFSSDALPTSLDLADFWAGHDLYLTATLADGSALSANGTITTLVPEPMTVGMLMVSVALWRRRN